MPLILQTARNWCWAACIEMVRVYDAKTPLLGQCDLANSAFSMANCCSTPTSPQCDQPLPVSSVKPEWLKYGYGSTFNNNHLPWAQTHNDIYNRRPIEAGLLWTGGGGHAVLIVGVDTLNGTEWVIVHDPARPLPRTVTQRDMEMAFGLGTWRWSWNNIV
ncbi:MAG TPA: papain-like cysteine protease family protein [Allosphingosinicella sp.]